jgi:hypothetical protein
MTVVGGLYSSGPLVTSLPTLLPFIPLFTPSSKTTEVYITHLHTHMFFLANLPSEVVSLTIVLSRLSWSRPRLVVWFLARSLFALPGGRLCNWFHPYPTGGWRFVFQTFSISVLDYSTIHRASSYKNRFQFLFFYFLVDGL